jgi:hypothetical protein
MEEIKYTIYKLIDPITNEIIIDYIVIYQSVGDMKVILNHLNIKTEKKLFNMI